MEQKRLRASNMELLRIVAMLLVMMVHASFYALDVPTRADMEATPLSAFLRYLSESVSIVCVNVFILISGWFGIHARWSRLAAFVFQVLFLTLAVHLLLRFSGYAPPMGLKAWLKWLTLRNGYWFVQAYMVFYICTPLLNSFVESASRRQLAGVLLAFFTLQTIYGFVGSAVWYDGGYSPLSFMGLYLLARYLRLYPTRLTQLGKAGHAAIYAGCTLLTTLLALLLTRWERGWMLYAYSAPLVIVASVALLLFFSKWSFHSRAVNWVGASAFAAYIVHCHPDFFEPYYLPFIVRWYHHGGLLPFLLATGLWIMLIFAVSILLDKVRMAAWRGGMQLFKSRR